MLLTIAWRNIWRNRSRSLVIIGAIILGIWALSFLNSWMMGMGEMYVADIIDNQTSHIQIHNEEFLKEHKSEFVIPNSNEVINELKRTQGIESMSARIIVNGIVTAPRMSKGVSIRAVNPADEAAVVNLNNKIKAGDYFNDEKRNPILIGEALAEKLKIKVGKKITLQYQDLNGELTAQVYRIVGLYSSGNTKIDQGIVYVRHQDFAPVFKNEGNVHEIAIRVNDFEKTKTIATGLGVTLRNLKVQNYEEVMPMIKLFDTQFKTSGSIITTIVMIALIFGIINTMLMAVLERVKELGVLMAVGMNRIRVFGMIVIETLLLSIVGLPVGIVMGFITVVYLNKNGIDLSSYEAGLSDFGMSSMIYPYIDPSFFVSISISVFFTALMASLYPAFKATRLRPIEAINKI